jgi:hypothetical protein
MHERRIDTAVKDVHAVVVTVSAPEQVIFWTATGWILYV